MFEILGYSERGVINALFYDILNSSKPNELISDLLNINDKKKEQFKISSCKVLIEQSFSDFGDSDVLLLIENKGKKQAVFLEAKVKTYSRKKWRLVDEFDKFLNPKGKAPSTDNAIPTSNLFTQLYFKNRLWDELKNNNGGKLDKGIKFENTTKSPRKIGKNEIVIYAKNLLSKYLDKSFYLGIVPNSRIDINKFIPSFRNKESEIKLNLINWNSANWGFLSWKDIFKFCKNKNLTKTQIVFKFNKGQIY